MSAHSRRGDEIQVRERLQDLILRERVVTAYQPIMDLEDRTVERWGTGGWNDDGKNTTIWPDFTWRFRHRTRRFDTRAYVMRRPADVSAPASPANDMQQQLGAIWQEVLGLAEKDTVNTEYGLGYE